MTVNSIGLFNTFNTNQHWPSYKPKVLNQTIINRLLNRVRFDDVLGRSWPSWQADGKCDWNTNASRIHRTALEGRKKKSCFFVSPKNMEEEQQPFKKPHDMSRRPLAHHSPSPGTAFLRQANGSQRRATGAPPAGRRRDVVSRPSSAAESASLRCGWSLDGGGRQRFSTRPDGSATEGARVLSLSLSLALAAVGPASPLSLGRGFWRRGGKPRRWRHNAHKRERPHPVTSPSPRKFSSARQRIQKRKEIIMKLFLKLKEKAKIQHFTIKHSVLCFPTSFIYCHVIVPSCGLVCHGWVN